MPLRPRYRHAFIAIVALSAGAASAACGSDRAASSAKAMLVSTARCGDDWKSGPGGVTSFTMTNNENTALSVYLRATGSGKVYFEVEGFGANATVTEQATLADGNYQLVCSGLETGPVPGTTVRVTNGASLASAEPGIVPVTSNDLLPISIAYKNWVTAQLPTLREQISTLADAVKQGPTPAAKADWLTAHLTYETLGAAYDAFGDLDAGIDSPPALGVDPVTAEDLTGFHKIEALLWSGAPAAKLTPAVADLASCVDNLVRQFPDAEIDPNDIALRAHEIIENAVEFELNGTTDAGSHTNLATVGANIVGSQKALSFLLPLLQSRYPDLAKTQDALTNAARVVAAFDHNGSWTPLDSLTRAQREAVNAALDNAVELLASVAAICDERLPGAQS